MVRVAAMVLLVLLGLTACGGGTPAPTATAVPPPTGSAREPEQSPTPAESIVREATPGLAGADLETPSPTVNGTLTPSPPPVTSSTAPATPKATVAPPPTPSPEATSTPASPPRQPTPMVPAFEFQDVTVTGLIATVPGYARLDAGEVAGLVERVYPGRVPTSVQTLVVLTEADQAHLVLALDTNIDRFITAGTVVGLRVPPMEGLPAELDFAGRVIVSDNVALMEPVEVTPDQVNKRPEQYIFQRVALDTTYLFAGARIKDAPPSLEHIGFGLATDKLGSRSRDDYLTIVDPYNTETQFVWLTSSVQCSSPPRAQGSY